MPSCILLLSLLAFSSIAVAADLQNLKNAAKFIADIYQTLPNGCVFIMNSEAQQQGENNLISFD
jgi:hypothetical protein